MIRLLEDSLRIEKTVTVYYSEEVLTKLAEDKVKEVTGLDIKIEVDYDDIIEYGWYFLRFVGIWNMDYEDLEHLEEVLGDIESSGEITDTLGGLIFDDYAELGNGSGMRERYSGQFAEGNVDLPVIFTLENYEEFQKKVK